MLNLVRATLERSAGNDTSAALHKNLGIHVPEEDMWLSSSSSRLDINGSSPTQTRFQLGLSTSNGILYFTNHGIYGLSILMEYCLGVADGVWQRPQGSNCAQSREKRKQALDNGRQ